MSIKNKDIVDSKKLLTGAKIIYFSNGKYKFIPSRNYMELKEKYKFKKIVQKNALGREEHCSKLIDSIFEILKYK